MTEVTLVKRPTWLEYLTMNAYSVGSLLANRLSFRGVDHAQTARD